MKKGQRIGYRRSASQQARYIQRRGRRREHELRDILKAAGWDAACTGIYDTLDVLWGLRGRDRLCEVKSKKRSIKWAFDALEGGAHAVFLKVDRKPWVIIQFLSEYMVDNSPGWPEDAPKSTPSGDREREVPVEEISEPSDRLVTEPR